MANLEGTCRLCGQKRVFYPGHKPTAKEDHSKQIEKVLGMLLNCTKLCFYFFLKVITVIFFK